MKKSFITSGPGYFPEMEVQNQKSEIFALVLNYYLPNPPQCHKYNYILNVNEKLPVSKFRYFGKYLMQLFGYYYVHVSGQRQAGLEK